MGILPLPHSEASGFSLLFCSVYNTLLLPFFRHHKTNTVEGLPDLQNLQNLLAVPAPVPSQNQFRQFLFCPYCNFAILRLLHVVLPFRCDKILRSVFGPLLVSTLFCYCTSTLVVSLHILSCSLSYLFLQFSTSHTNCHRCSTCFLPKGIAGIPDVLCQPRSYPL